MGKHKAEPVGGGPGHQAAVHATATAQVSRRAAPRREGVTPASHARTLARRVGDQRARWILAGADPGGTPPRIGRPELAVNAPGDAYEREADRVADAVMGGAPAGVAGRGGGTALRRCACGGMCATCRGEERSEPLRREVNGSDASTGFAPPLVHQVLSSVGRPLQTGTRAFMESGFGADFGGVRVHTDGPAAESARAVNAYAYTVGSHIAFAEGRYAPGTREGDRLIAHELTHVVQQGAGGDRGGGTRAPVEATPASAAGPGGSTEGAPLMQTAARGIQRQPNPRETQTNPVAGELPGFSREAVAKMFADAAATDKIKAPIAAELTRGYLNRGYGSPKAAPGHGDAPYRWTPAQGVAPVATPLAVPTLHAGLTAVEEPTEREVYGAIYNALDVSKIVKGGKATDWTWREPPYEKKTKDEKLTEIGTFAVEELISGTVEPRALVAFAWLTRRALGGYLAIVTGAAEIYLLASTVIEVFELIQSLGEPAALSPAEQRNADIVADVKAWMQQQHEMEEAAETMKQPFQNKVNVMPQDDTRIGP